MSLTKSIFKDRFLFLLVSLLLLIAVTPLLKDFIGLNILLDIFITVVLVSGIYAVSDKKAHAVLAGLLALPMLLATWSAYFIEVQTILLLGRFFGILFILLTGVLILQYISRQQQVSKDVIYGAIVVYLLIGVMWAFIYTVTEGLQPGSFNLPGGTFRDSEYIFFYHSFVTLTTLGYGDITPATGPARSLSLLEAVIGQVYLTVLVAILVGMYISQSMEKRSR